jgi:ATP-dependent DNA helicase DinG
MSAPESPDQAKSRSAHALALAVRAGRGLLVSRDGEFCEAGPDPLARALSGQGLLLVHAPFLSRRLGQSLRGKIFDLAELFAFIHPASFATPTAQGLADALGLGTAPTLDDEAALLHRLADRLLADLAAAPPDDRASAVAAARVMARADWSWGPDLLAALNPAPDTRTARYMPWHDLAVWEETPPRAEPSAEPVTPDESRRALDRLLARALDPAARETRADQAAYAEAAAGIFGPREKKDEPAIVLAEAGTGIGKTLGYLAPAALWSRRNQGTVWISTYTKNLQRQIAQTLARVSSPDDEARLRTVVRKGRENYLCLLNFEEMANAPLSGVAAGLVGRWLERTKDGDMVGGDFPAWLVPLISLHGTARDAQGLGLTDRRGECIYGACAHFRRCFIEAVRVKTEDAEIVVANHALLLTRVAGDARSPPRLGRTPLTRLVLDEGHHLFEAADDAFSVHLTARELADLRRALRGPEARGRRSRGRNLLERAAELLPDDPEAQDLLQRVTRLAHGLPSELWRRNLLQGAPGPTYRFLAAVEAQVTARAARAAGDEYGLECPVRPVTTELAAAGAALGESFKVLAGGIKLVIARLAARLDEDADEIDTPTRERIEAVVRGLTLRADAVIAPWSAMLDGLVGEAPEGVIEWLSLSRGEGGDLGMHRHALDPTIALAAQLYRPSHGVLITSATLFDGQAAQRDTTGASHLARAPVRLSFPSPFPYAEASRFLVVRDVDTRDLEQLAAAMRVLFHAAGGGALGLFTAIARLRAVYKRLKAPLETLGLPLYAQHIDEIDAGTLVDIFRSEIHSCLLGTDAVREGIDVAGRSLRLLVLERVPWARPDLVHKARAAHFGGRAYEEEIARRRITQAFGRLIRRGDDKGVFVILGAQVPSRLLAGLPADVEIERTGLAEASRQIAEFLL